MDRPGGDPEPAGPELQEPDWPGDAENTAAAGPGVSVTRPQPIYHADDQGADDQGEPADEVHLGPGSGGETSVPVTPATGWRAPEPSVWDEASRQVEQEQAQPPGQEQAPGQEQVEPAGRRDHPEFHWDEDPHQRVVWGAEHARAKAARATEETLPNAEHSDDRD